MMKNFAFFAGAVIFVFALGIGFAEHEISSESYIEIQGIFGTESQRNWTGSETNENASIVILNNGTSNDSIVSFNITIPSGFTLDNSTINNSRGWECSNISMSVVSCQNDSADDMIDASENIRVWFNVTSPPISSETSYTWVLSSYDNATNDSSLTLISRVDGLVTNGAQPDVLEPYMSSLPTINWTLVPGNDSVSGIANYTIYNSTFDGNYTLLGVLPGTTTTYAITELIPDSEHFFILETSDLAGNAVNSSVFNTTYDISAPVVLLNTTDNANFSNTRYPRLYFNATDNYDSNMSCELFVDGAPAGTGYITNATSGLSIASNTSFMNTGYSWNVNCTDDAGNTQEASSARTFNVRGADVDVLGVYFNTSDDPNPVRTSDITIYALLNNSGNMNMSTNATLTFYVDNVLAGTATVRNDTLTAGNTHTYNVTKTGLDVNGFNHTVWAQVTYDGTELDSIDDNTNYNRTLYIGYNVTVTALDDYTLTPGQNVTLSVSVKYPNGTGVVGLSKKNFTIGDIKDIWSGSEYIWVEDSNYQIPTDFSLNNRNVFNSSFAEVGGGAYNFKLGAYNDTTLSTTASSRFGLHNIKVSIARNESGYYFSGMGNRSQFNLTAPMFDIIFKIKGTSTDLEGLDEMDPSQVEDYDVYVHNTGNVALDNVNITVTNQDDIFEEVDDDEDDCTTASVDIAAGATVKVCYIEVETESGNYGERGTIYLKALGSYNSLRYQYTGDNLDIDIADDDSDDTSDTTTTTTSSSPSVSTSTDYPNCEENDDCWQAEYCSSGRCRELSCADDEVATNHKCVAKSESETQETEDAQEKSGITITGAPTELEIDHIEERNTTIKIHNNDETDITGISVSLKIMNGTGATGEWYAFTEEYPKTIEAGNGADIKITLKTAGLSIGRYTIGALVTGDGSSDETTFLVRVTPNDNEITYINRTMSEMETELSKILNQMTYEQHKNPNGTGIAESNASCERLKILIESAKAAISTGDFLTAYEMQTEAKDLAIQIKEDLDAMDETDDGESHLVRNSLIFITVLAAVYVGFNYYESRNLTGKKMPHIPGKHNFNAKNTPKGGSDTLRDISFLKSVVKSKKGDNVKPEINHVERIYGKKEKKKKGLGKIVYKIINKRKNKKTGQKTLYDIGYSVKTRKK